MIKCLPKRPVMFAALYGLAGKYREQAKITDSDLAYYEGYIQGQGGNKLLKKRIKNIIPNTCGLITTFNRSEQMVREHMRLG